MHVLVVERSPGTRRAIRDCLTHARYQVWEAADGTALGPLVRQESIGMVITAWPVPDVDGVELLRRLRLADWHSYIYVLLLARPDDQELLARGIHAGADDYMVKPINLKELRRRVILGTRVLDLERRLRQVQQERDQLQTHDHLTGLLTRQALYEHLALAFGRYQRDGEPFSLALAQIEQLDTINDLYGYPFGNQALRIVGDTIVRATRRPDLAGRWNGSSMLILLQGTPQSAAVIVIERLRVQLAAAPLALPDGKVLPLQVRLRTVGADVYLPLSLAELLGHVSTAADGPPRL